MTKIFRSSFYRSKRPEEEEESAAGEYEYVDLEDGKGGKHAGGGGGGGGGGGVDPDGHHASGAVLTTIIGISCILAGCFYLVCPCGLEPARAVRQEATFVIIAGALFLAFAAAAFACLAVLRGYAWTSCWRTSPVSD